MVPTHSKGLAQSRNSAGGRRFIDIGPKLSSDNILQTSLLNTRQSFEPRPPNIMPNLQP
jgi:hypothetical protein